MKTEEIREIINDIRDKNLSNKLVVFVGAGVSKNVPSIPDWNELVKKMADAINYNKYAYNKTSKTKCIDDCSLKDKYSSDELLKIPQFLYNKDPNEYYRVLRTSIGHKPINDAPFSNIIFQINPAHIITTNYDRLLESNNHINRSLYDVIIDDKEMLASNKAKYILKMHGDIKHPETIILKEQDYLDYSHKHVLMEMFIKSLLTNHTFLFIGYSLNDYNIKLIFNWINYMRSMNNKTIENRKIGYIVLDDENLNEDDALYFNKNNIGVINICDFLINSNIPTQITHDKGKKLYSFLQTISNPRLGKWMINEEYARKEAEFLLDYKYINCKQLLEFLNIDRYDIDGNHLGLSIKDDFDYIKKLIDDSKGYSSIYKQKFIDAGIKCIECDFDRIIIEGHTESLFNDEWFLLYLKNNYVEINKKINRKTFDKNQKYFYRSILFHGYDIALPDLQITSKKGTINLNDKLSNLFNINFARLDCSDYDNLVDIHRYIKNISDKRARDFLNPFIAITGENDNELLKLETNLNQLKEDISNNKKYLIGGPINKLDRIRRIVLNYYRFYYYNYLFYNGTSNLSSILKYYIEGLLCYNSTHNDKDVTLGEMHSVENMYKANIIDFDIITKFAGNKDLINYIRKYNVKSINTTTDCIEYMAQCFYNLSISITDKKTYGYNLSNITVLSNIALLLSMYDCSDNAKAIISNSIAKLFNNGDFDRIFFSHALYNGTYCLGSFIKLMKRIKVNHNFGIVNKIVNSERFFEFCESSGIYRMREFLSFFIQNKNNQNLQKSIINLIDAFENVKQKITVIRLFYYDLKKEPIKQNYVKFIFDNISSLNADDIDDFVLDGNVTVTDDVKEQYINETLEIYRKEPDKNRLSNKCMSRIESLCLWYILDVIDSVDGIKEVSDNVEIVKFLLDPNTYDYSNVDFTYYMWKNFAYVERFLNCFIEHKDDLIPRIKEHIEEDNSNEFEKKLLYGYLLDKSELFSFN